MNIHVQYIVTKREGGELGQAPVMVSFILPSSILFSLTLRVGHFHLLRCFVFILLLGSVSNIGSVFSCCKICRLTFMRISYNLPILSYSGNPLQCPQRNPTKSEGHCERRLTFEMPKQVCCSRYIHSWGIVSPLAMAE